MFQGKEPPPVRLSALRKALCRMRMSGPPFTVTAPPRLTVMVVTPLTACSIARSNRRARPI